MTNHNYAPFSHVAMGEIFWLIGDDGGIGARAIRIGNAAGPRQPEVRSSNDPFAGKTVNVVALHDGKQGNIQFRAGQVLWLDKYECVIRHVDKRNSHAETTNQHQSHPCSAATAEPDGPVPSPLRQGALDAALARS